MQKPVLRERGVGGLEMVRARVGTAWQYFSHGGGELFGETALKPYSQQ
jgi:hypothetical protein